MSDIVDKPAGEIATVGNGTMRELISVLDKAVRNPEIDPARVREFIELAEKLHDRHARQAFNEAMVKAQADIRPVATNQKNSETKSEYADYWKLDQALRPIYTKHGFALSFDTGDVRPEAVDVLCHVSHVEGHERTYHVDMPADGKGAKGGAVMSRTHATGAAMTYGRRYLLCLIFNIPIGKDDDGNGASGGLIGERQIESLRGMFKRFSDPAAMEKKIVDFYKVPNLESLKAGDYLNAVEKTNNYGLALVDAAKKKGQGQK